MHEKSSQEKEKKLNWLRLTHNNKHPSWFTAYPTVSKYHDTNQYNTNYNEDCGSTPCRWQNNKYDNDYHDKYLSWWILLMFVV